MAKKKQEEVKEEVKKEEAKPVKVVVVKGRREVEVIENDV